MVALCMVGYVFSFIDRQVITLLVEPIRSDLGISDTGFSLLYGAAFALFYAIMGIPIARLADTRSRPLIIAAGIFVWSLATAVCGMTKNFWQLLVARMAVGCGEAALSPAAYSMISDTFPRSQLGVALGVYSIGSFIGAGLALLIGGSVIAVVTEWGVLQVPLIGTVKPWQTTFFIVGVPGLLIAALFFFTVRDPERKVAVGVDAGATRAYSIREVFAYIVSHKATFGAHYVGFGFLSMTLYALLAWGPTFLMRGYALSPRDVGLYFGTLVLVCNTTGVLTSGWLADHLTRRSYGDAAMRAGAIGGLGAIVPAALFSSAPGLGWTLLGYGLAMYFASFPMATSAAALQLMAPNQMRAQVTALFFLFMNLLGITGGSLLVGLSTDYVFGADSAVGYSISIVAACSAFAGAACLRWGFRHYQATAEAVAADTGGP